MRGAPLGYFGSVGRRQEGSNGIEPGPPSFWGRSEEGRSLTENGKGQPQERVALPPGSSQRDESLR